MVDEIRSSREVLADYGPLVLLEAFENSSSNLQLLEPLARARAESQLSDANGLFRKFMPEMHFDSGYCEIQGDSIMLRVRWVDLFGDPWVTDVELTAEEVAQAVEEVYFPRPEE